MNYYEHHLGDYARDAGHLSLIEDGAYRRLIDAYYAREKPLPTDVKECQKLARCTTAAERKAVAYVLEAFFQRQDDGYHQKRCDEEIADYLEGEPDREVKKENNRERQRRARTRRRELYEALRSHGIVPDFDATTKELEARLSRVTSGNSHATVTRDGSKDVTRDERVTTRLPVSNLHSQSPIPSPQDSESESSPSGAVLPGPPPELRRAASGNGESQGGGEGILPGLAEQDREPTRFTAGANPKPEGVMAVALRNAHVVVTSADPVLHGWLKDGITTERLLEAVAIARIRKPHDATIAAGYIDKIVRDPTRNNSGADPTRKLTRYEQMQEALKNA